MGFITSKKVSALKSTPAASVPLNVKPQTPHLSNLPDEPLVTIKPSGSLVPLDLRHLWSYRELLYFLIWRDLKIRYKQTVLGVAWTVMHPLLMTLVFTIFLGKVARVPSDNIPYSLFVFAGLIPWTLFASAITSSGDSLIRSANLITKVYFPRMIIPIAAIGARLVDFAVSFAVLLALMAYYGVRLSSGILMLPVLVLLLLLLALGVGLMASSLNVKYRDIGVALPVLIQLWMFASPVVYPTSLVPAKWRPFYVLNPLTGVIEGFRSALFGLPFDWFALVISTAVALILLVCSAYFFRSLEKSFADTV